MTISPIFRDFEWKSGQFQREFKWYHWNYVIWALTEIHEIELKWHVILTQMMFWTLKYTTRLLGVRKATGGICKQSRQLTKRAKYKHNIFKLFIQKDGHDPTRSSLPSLPVVGRLAVKLNRFKISSISPDEISILGFGPVTPSACLVTKYHFSFCVPFWSRGVVNSHWLVYS